MAVIPAAHVAQQLRNEMRKEIMNIEATAVPVTANLMSWGEWWELWGDQDTDAPTETNIEFDVE
jgi:hypothetical protein